MKQLKNLEDIKAIVIPTCDIFDSENLEDFNRAKTAIEFVNKNNLPKKCIIAGFGNPICSPQILSGSLKNHKPLYNYLKEKTDWIIGIETNSNNSIENLLYTFPNEIKGKYAIVSFPLHLKRFNRILNDAKKSGVISEELDLVYVPTKQNPKWIFYETLSTLKYFLVGKNKYFNNSV